MNFPIQIRFKILALAPQIYVKDSAGTEICYVKQKLLKLKEKVEVFTNSSRQQLLCTIGADRIIDFNANYEFRAADGVKFGSVGRRGMRSLWRAHYEVKDANGNLIYTIREENPFVKVMDGLLEGIPVVGMFAGYLFQPKYAVLRGDTPVMRMSKHRSFLESRFEVTEISNVSSDDELRIVLSLLMFALLERSRG